MERLKQVLTQEDTVLFVGSGISLWSGLPSWSGMIEELAKFVESSGGNADLVRAEAERGDLLQAASYGFDSLSKPQIGEFIRVTCRYGQAKPHEIHRKIVSLGTRCFVTTNYDNLLEEALRKWQPGRSFRPPITNRHLTETAEIVHARAMDFVFKPHGDVGDSESIILTREQYRQLLPQGERANALESLKMLLATRPVVYLGFGLRDPDFLYVRDILANIYRGGTRDHYAIMPDVAQTECDYWRRHYGIHLVNYSTTHDPDGKRNHSELITLLDSLLLPTPGKVSTTNLALSLARHAARLLRAPRVNPEVSIRVHSEYEIQRRDAHFYHFDRFDHYPIGKFLDEGPDRALIVGLPGAGKTYALRQAAARLANNLHEASLSEPFDDTAVVIPIFVDLKDYRGSLTKLVSDALPSGLRFVELTHRFRSKIFLDSFNEMPREYWENGSYEGDFANFTEAIGRSSLIIGSRTTDGLSKLGMPAYRLDQIDDTVVTNEMIRMGIDIGGRFGREVRLLLQKPFYFQYVTSGAVKLPREAHPRDFYQAFFENLNSAFVTRFGKSFPIEDALSTVAYNAINCGEEAYPLADLLRVLQTTAEEVELTDISAHDIANWLVSDSILIPHSGGRIAFVHQSITEYLAAKELARLYLETPKLLKEKLTLRRWDQALFLALSLLPTSQAEAFFNDVASADFTLALTAVKYLEVGRDGVVSKLLNAIPAQIALLGQYNSNIEWLFELSLPISAVHEPQLRELMKLGDSIGCAAVIRLIAMKGSEIKGELLHEFVRARSDYNYCCNGIGRGLAPFAAPEDVKKVIEMADSISWEITPDSDDEAVDGFICGTAAFLAVLDIAVVKKGFLPDAQTEPLPDIYSRILCQMLWEQCSTSALALAGELLLRGVNRAAVAIYFIARPTNAEHDLSWASFTVEHLDRLIAIAYSSEETCWALKALKCLCIGRPDFSEIVIARAAERSGFAKAALIYCAGSGADGAVFAALRDLTRMAPVERTLEPLHLLEHLEISWVGNEALLTELLKMHDTQLALPVLESAFKGYGSPPGILEIGPIHWWLDWLSDESDPDSGLSYALSELFAHCLSGENRQALVSEFNKAGSKYRSVLSTILASQHDLTTNDFSEDAVSFLLAELDQADFRERWGVPLLSNTATERFIAERLLPLVPGAEEPRLGNLRKVLRQAGSRHGRRYIVD